MRQARPIGTTRSRLLTILVTVALIGSGSPAIARHVTEGAARVVTGSLIVVDHTVIEIAGIVTPRLSQAGGDLSRAVLLGLVENNHVVCTELVRTGYRRVIAQCNVLGLDVAEQMLLRGAATRDPDFACWRSNELLDLCAIYAAAERSARGAAAGLWGMCEDSTASDDLPPTN